MRFCHNNRIGNTDFNYVFGLPLPKLLICPNKVYFGNKKEE